MRTLATTRGSEQAVPVTAEHALASANPGY